MLDLVFRTPRIWHPHLPLLAHTPLFSRTNMLVRFSFYIKLCYYIHMRISRLFSRPRKEAPKDEISKNAQLLLRAGFIHKEMAGVYSYLPLGLRVLNNIQHIIREEMNRIGGQELLLTALQDKEVWEKTNRWNDHVVDVWFKTALKSGGELGLANTHEEAIAALMTHHISSYKDLPFAAYQFQTKFRNETRAKSGIMRTREFIMKDLYSFHTDEKSLDAFYEQVSDAYMRIFARVGLGDVTYKTFASGGAFSKFSHEFQTICDAGEDHIYVNTENNIAINEEVYTEETLKTLSLDTATLDKKTAIEVGNIFKLGTKYSEPLGLMYTDETGEKKPVVMGSYGIGPGRLMGAVVETLSDDKGIVWPESIAPFKVIVTGLGDSSAVREKTDELYEMLVRHHVDTLYDDTQDRPGEKFSRADLFGIPIRLVVSEKTLAEGDMVEIKRRTETDTDLVPCDDIVALVK